MKLVLILLPLLAIVVSEPSPSTGYESGYHGYQENLNTNSGKSFEGLEKQGEIYDREDRSTNSSNSNFSDSDVQDDGGNGGWQDAVPGTPGKDYPNLKYIPETSFSCADKKPGGYYADVETGCQVFHVCSTVGLKSSFLCPAGSIFNQKYFVCDWWYDFECDNAPELYSLNNQLNRQDSEESRQQADDSRRNQPYSGYNDGGNSLNDGADLSLAGTADSRNPENSRGDYRANFVNSGNEEGGPVKSIVQDFHLDGRGLENSKDNGKMYHGRITVNYWPPKNDATPETNQQKRFDEGRRGRKNSGETNASPNYLPPKNRDTIPDNAPRGFSLNRGQADKENSFDKNEGNANVDETQNPRDDGGYFEPKNNGAGSSQKSFGIDNQYLSPPSRVNEAAINDFPGKENTDYADDDEEGKLENSEDGSTRDGNFGKKFNSNPRVSYLEPSKENRGGDNVAFQVPFRPIANDSEHQTTFFRHDSSFQNEANYDNSRFVGSESSIAAKGHIFRTIESILTSERPPLPSSPQLDDAVIQQIRRPTGGLRGGLGNGYPGPNKSLPGSNVIAGTTSATSATPTERAPTTSSYNGNERNRPSYPAGRLDNTERKYIPPGTQEQGRVKGQNSPNNRANDQPNRQRNFQQYLPPNNGNDNFYPTRGNGNDDNAGISQTSTNDFGFHQYLPPAGHGVGGARNYEHANFFNPRRQDRYLPALYENL